MQILYGIYASQILDNILFNCPRGQGGQQETYAMIVTGSYAQYNTPSNINLIARNMIANAAGTGNQRNIALYASAGTAVVNNLIINADDGIVMRLEGAPYFENTAVLFNTVYYIRSYDNNRAALDISDAGSNDQSTFVIQNNIFSVGGTSAFGYRFSPPSSATVISNNYFDGMSYQELDEITQMLPLPSGVTEADIFVNPSLTIPGADFMCKGILVDAGTNSGVNNDFDTNTRPVASGYDIGCYEASSGYHWPINYQFKGSSAPAVTSTSASSDGGSDGSNTNSGTYGTDGSSGSPANRASSSLVSAVKEVVLV